MAPPFTLTFSWIESEFVAHGHALAGKSFVELPQVDVVFFESGLSPGREAPRVPGPCP